jgi:hypothetical protein
MSRSIPLPVSRDYMINCGSLRAAVSQILQESNVLLVLPTEKIRWLVEEKLLS